MRFEDRRDAGSQLAKKLQKYKDQKNVVVFGLARGGVVTASVIAFSLHLPLSVIVVRKIGAPANSELALGAISEHGKGMFNDELIAMLGVDDKALQREVLEQREVLKNRLALYRKMAPAIDLKGKTAILVDDGIATGASMRVAIQSVRAAGALKVIMAVPVAAPSTLRKIEKEVDESVCLYSPESFEAVGCFYNHFEQTRDEDVIRLLSAH
jgi:putative phosphoribosyl transferase